MIFRIIFMCRKSKRKFFNAIVRKINITFVINNQQVKMVKTIRACVYIKTRTLGPSNISRHIIGNIN